MMKKYTLPSIALAALLSSNIAAAYDIQDTTIGSGDSRDVIGANSIFDTHGMNASISGSILTVDVFTNFAGQADNVHFPAETQTAASGFGNGIGYGDLLLSSSDTADGWDYGFSLDDRWSATGGAADLYALGDSSLLLSNDFISSGTYRPGHAVAVDTAAADQVSTGSWLVNENDGLLSFSIDIAGTDLANADSLSLGWGMTCANDLIQGTVATPDITTNVAEPDALSLVCLGMIGSMLAHRRKKSEKKS